MRARPSNLEVTADPGSKAPLYAKPAQIEYAGGWPRKVVGPLGRMNGRRVVTANWLRKANGRHRVRFVDGNELWVAHGARPETDFVRFRSATRQAAADGSPYGADR